MVEHHRRDAVPADPTLDVRQVQRHDLVTDDLVDDRLREEDSFGAAVEPSEQRSHGRGIAHLGPAGEASKIGEQDTRVHRRPAGGRSSTQVSHSVGFFRDGR